MSGAWREPSPIDIPQALRDAIGGHPLVAEILARRGWTDPVATLGFLDAERYVPALPTELPDLGSAARTLHEAVLRRRRILVWGDFDVDGQTATALLVSALRDLGADVVYYIPQRLVESHGIKVNSLTRQLDAQPIDVLLTCDTGIAEHDAIAHAKSRGLTVLVTDHHDLPDSLPDADALVNPKRLPRGHSLRDLPGVGVAFKLIQHILDLAGGDASDSYLDLVALGIVADVARQVADTRYLLQRGLDRLRRPQRLGLQVLMQSAQLDATNVTADHIGFVLGPRLNAIGRMGDAAQAVELLTTTDLTRARIIASQIEILNNQRRLLTEQVYASAQEQIAGDPAVLDGGALVLCRPNWHAGVVGLVAARLAEEHAMPAVLLIPSNDGIARGSARSAPGINLSAALRLVREHLLAFGGHPGAAGLSLRTDDVARFRLALSRAVETVRDESVAPAMTLIDAFVSLRDVTLDLARDVERLAPFGEGNPPVVLAARGVSIVDSRSFGRRGEHRSVVVEDEQAISHRMAWWRGADEDLPEGQLDVAFTLKSTDSRGAQAVSIEWVAARQVAAIRLEAPGSQIEVIDWRRAPDVERNLDGIRAAGYVIWADGELPRNVPARRRYDLAKAEALVVWRAPAGPKELALAVQHVSPTKVYLCDVDRAPDRLEAFVRRLAGLLKHDLQQREGRVNVLRLAAASGQRPATVRKGIEWLTAHGKISIVEEDGDTLRIGVDWSHSAESRQDDSALEIELELKALLAETAAYRAYYLRADADRLIRAG